MGSYSYSTNEEYYTGEFESPEEAIKFARLENKSEIESGHLTMIWVGESEKITFDDLCPDAYHIIEYMQERCYDELAEYGDGFLDEFNAKDFDKEKQKQIDLDFYEAIKSVLLKHKLPTEPTGWRVINAKPIVLSEVPDDK